MGTTERIEVPPALLPVFAPPRGSVRFRWAYGGRGSAKTRTFALMSAVRAYELEKAGESGVILCAREFQNSLDESSMEEVKQAIRSVPWLDEFFELGEKFIRTKSGRVKYVFAGLRRNVDSIKSKARILLCWIDEAEPVSEVAYQKLLPTVREENSECWVTWNPELDGSPTDQRFIKNPPEDGVGAEVNWWDNPFLPLTLKKQRTRDKKNLDPATYAHIWEGAYLENSETQVLHGKVRVAEFEPGANWQGPYNGLDFGFSNDPTAAVRCWVHNDALWVEREAYKVGLELRHTKQYLDERLPGVSEQRVYADNARPESISDLKHRGMRYMRGCKKWSGSVRDGVTHLRSYAEIVVHPRCVNTLKETRLYSHKVDEAGEPLPDVVDANNHAIDALRYALEPRIKTARKKARVT